MKRLIERYERKKKIGNMLQRTERRTNKSSLNFRCCLVCNKNLKGERFTIKEVTVLTLKLPTIKSKISIKA